MKQQTKTHTVSSVKQRKYDDNNVVGKAANYDANSSVGEAANYDGYSTVGEAAKMRREQRGR